MRENKSLTILSGHFGCGKTEIAINLALKEKQNHDKVAINDLDIINPYFRSRDAAALFHDDIIRCILRVKKGGISRIGN
ncbi:hypothetical protein [Bacillus sp. MRMR6]|uniref:hypothetical protein n=1 Tax=Bacillus sp. MRMR6 TaxID=1928617 RepID=UPI000951DCCC|nr:hypothetical protein [Bacillus sp. MRMR6]OLS33464.1 hypothetical protein BTR25_25755 [Bacillus sp. MRMR6]